MLPTRVVGRDVRNPKHVVELGDLCLLFSVALHDLNEEYKSVEGKPRLRTDLPYCDNWHCGGTHSHNSCQMKARCKGCEIPQDHYFAQCKSYCWACNSDWHTVRICHLHTEGKNKERNSGTELWTYGPLSKVFREIIYPFYLKIQKSENGKVRQCDSYLQWPVFANCDRSSLIEL